MRYLIALTTLVLLAGCNRGSNDEISRFHEDGRIKPSIAIALIQPDCSLLSAVQYTLNRSREDEWSFFVEF